MESDEHSFAPAGTMRKPSITLICEWVKVAWEEVKTETIIKSLKKCGISNDTAIWLESDEDTADSEDSFADLDSEHEDILPQILNKLNLMVMRLMMLDK